MFTSLQVQYLFFSTQPPSPYFSYHSQPCIPIWVLSCNMHYFCIRESPTQNTGGLVNIHWTTTNKRNGRTILQENPSTKLRERFSPIFTIHLNLCHLLMTFIIIVDESSLLRRLSQHLTVGLVIFLRMLAPPLLSCY